MRIHKFISSEIQAVSLPYGTPYFIRVFASNRRYYNPKPAESNARPPTLILRPILILFSVCVFQVVTLFKFHKKLSDVLLSHTVPAIISFTWFDENNDIL